MARVAEHRAHRRAGAVGGGQALHVRAAIEVLGARGAEHEGSILVADGDVAVRRRLGEVAARSGGAAGERRALVGGGIAVAVERRVLDRNRDARAAAAVGRGGAELSAKALPRGREAAVAIRALGARVGGGGVCARLSHREIARRREARRDAAAVEMADVSRGRPAVLRDGIAAVRTEGLAGVPRCGAWHGDRPPIDAGAGAGGAGGRIGASQRRGSVHRRDAGPVGVAAGSGADRAGARLPGVSRDAGAAIVGRAVAVLRAVAGTTGYGEVGRAAAVEAVVRAGGSAGARLAAAAVCQADAGGRARADEPRGATGAAAARRLAGSAAAGETRARRAACIAVGGGARATRALSFRQARRRAAE